MVDLLLMPNWLVRELWLNPNEAETEPTYILKIKGDADLREIEFVPNYLDTFFS